MSAVAVAARRRAVPFNRVGLTLVLVLGAALLALGLPAGSLAAPPPSAPAELTDAQQRIENVIAAARQYLGVPYRLGAEGPDQMDCSGLVYRAFSDAGEVRRISGARLGVRSYVRWFAARGLVTLEEQDAQRGDLAVYGAGEHMGIYLGDGRVISAVLSGVTVHAANALELPLTGFLRVNWTGGGRAEPLDPQLLLDQSETPVALVAPAAWVPAIDAGAEGSQPERAGTERVDMRTATTRTFENPDGTLSTEFHIRPIYYQPADSTDWQPIDLAFTPIDALRGDAAAGARVIGSPIDLSAYPADAEAGFLVVAAGNRTVSVNLPVDSGASDAAPTISPDGRAVDYFRLGGEGLGLRVFARSDGFRSYLVLPEEPATNRFSFIVSAPGLEATAETDGSVALRDEVGAVAGRLPRPLLLDSSDVSGDGGGVYTAATALSVEERDDTALVTISVAHRYLDEAVYPAFIDFSLVDFPAAAPGAQLTFASSAHPNTNFEGYQRPEDPAYSEVWLGRQPHSRNYNEVYLRFDDPRATLGDVDIASAALELYPYWRVADDQALAVRRVAEAWDAAGVTWSQRPTTDSDIGTVELAAGRWTQVDLTEQVAARMSGAADFGLVLAAAQPGPRTWTRLIALDQDESAEFGPRLVVNWSGLRPTLGAADDSGPLTPRVAWTDAPVAGQQTRFEVLVSADDFATIATGSGVIGGRHGSATTWAVPAADLGVGTYSARVRTRSTGHGWSDWSAPYSFSYGPPRIRPVGFGALEFIPSDD